MDKVYMLTAKTNESGRKTKTDIKITDVEVEMVLEEKQVYN